MSLCVCVCVGGGGGSPGPAAVPSRSDGVIRRARIVGIGPK